MNELADRIVTGTLVFYTGLAIVILLGVGITAYVNNPVIATAVVLVWIIAVFLTPKTGI